MDFEELFHQFTQISIALSSERDIDLLLEKIVKEARAFSSAEGASLYLKEDGILRFALSYNEASSGVKQQYISSSETLPLDPNSMAGYVGITGEVLNIPDVYAIPSGSPYHFNDKFDREHHYRTQSMLLAPMKDIERNVIGVLALINARAPDHRVVPFDPRYVPLLCSLASQAAVAYTNAQLTKKIKDAYLDTVLRLSMAAECREPDIAGHLKRISEYSGILAQEMGFSALEVENIKYASPMHDVGKIGIPDSILMKPGKLTEEEYEEMKRHTLYASKILSDSSSEILQLSEQIALAHHEHYDGSGYPLGLKEREIPIYARIVALADVFDALASKRVYKESWEMEQVVDYICDRSGKQFDPEVVDAFRRRLPDFFEINRLYVNLDNGNIGKRGIISRKIDHNPHSN